MAGKAWPRAGVMDRMRPKHRAAAALGGAQTVLFQHRVERLSPADWVTLARATLAVGVAALVADSFGRPVPVTLLVSLAAVALVLDAVDGWVARRTRTTASRARASTARSTRS